MITIKAYKASNGTIHEELGSYQRAELTALFGWGDDSTIPKGIRDGIADNLIARAAEVVTILGIKERKKRAKEAKPRKALGKSLPKDSNPPGCPPPKVNSLTTHGGN